MSFRDLSGHYERHPYPHYPLLASIRPCDSYATNLTALWARFNGELLPERDGRILLAGCGAFSPYTMSVANPAAAITGVDLSRRNLRRAKAHCLVHGRLPARLLHGDFLDPLLAPGPYHYIEAYGVLHHLDDPAEGLRSLEQRLVPGGIIRVMVYGRYIRQQTESVRRAVRLLGIRDLKSLKALLRRAAPESRLRSYVDSLWEAETDSGLADLFLNPNVTTYRMDEFLEMVAHTGLKPLLFSHQDALADPEQEIARMRDLDRRRETCSNIICYLGRDCRGGAEPAADSLLLLNPALRQAVSRFTLRAQTPMDRLGHDNQPLDRQARRFLRYFRKPVREGALSADERRQVEAYLRALFLVRVR